MGRFIEHYFNGSLCEPLKYIVSPFDYTRDKEVFWFHGHGFWENMGIAEALKAL